jgi:transmembrane sensor
MSVQEQMERLRIRRAAEWYETFRSGEAGEQEREEFAAWIAESPLNSAAYYQITALARETREAAREAGLSGLRALRAWDSKVHPIAEEPTGQMEKPPAKSAHAIKLAWAIAAVVLLSVGGHFAIRTLETERYRTGVGEERTVSLADGSTIYLNAKSSLSVRIGGESRELQLEGEGYFEVAPDPRRPFRVRTADAVVQAVGTQFNVATRREGTNIAVLEGKVQVSSEPSILPVPIGPGGGDGATPLSAGEAVRVSPSGSIERRPAGEAANAVAWREHLVIIDGMTLEDAVEEFNKYQRVPRLRLENVPPGAYHYSGTFDARDPASFGEFLEGERNLSVERRGNEIVIRGRP